jgi:hypothetical protein
MGNSISENQLKYKSNKIYCKREINKRENKKGNN